jgi:hypothetical protein
VDDAAPDVPGSGRYGPADCIFCAIVAGSAPASIVYDDADLLAFMDIRPVTPGHLLVIPKRHTPLLADLDEATGARMFTVAMRLAQVLRASELRCEGINLFLADGEAASRRFFTPICMSSRGSSGIRSASMPIGRSPRRELSSTKSRLRCEQ